MSKISDKGYILTPEETIVEDIRTIFSNAFTGLNVTNESPMGQVALLYASLLNEFQEDAQAVFNSFDLDSASGQDLDSLGKLIGLERNRLTPTVITADLTSSSTGYSITEGDKFYLSSDSTLLFSAESTEVISTSPYTITMTSDDFIATGNIAVGDNLTSVSSYPELTDIEVMTVSDGIEEESDVSYRKRLKAVRVGLGASGIQRMQRALQEVTTIQDAKVFDINNDPSVALGTIEAVVLGGSDSVVANTIWDNLDMGTATDGTETVTIQDTNGDDVDVKFSRPTSLSATFQLQVSLITEITQAQRQSIVDVFTAFCDDSFIGGTLYYQDFYSAVVQIITGTSKISSLTINGGTSDIVATSRQKIDVDVTIDPNTNITVV